MLCEAAGLVALVLVLAFALSARNSISLQRPSLRLPLSIPAIEAAMLSLALEASRGPSHLWHVFHCYREVHSRVGDRWKANESCCTDMAASMPFGYRAALPAVERMISQCTADLVGWWIGVPFVYI